LFTHFQKIFLGVSSISPFGFVHGCCRRERIKIKDKIESNANNKNSDLEQRIKELEKLKIFLKDYVVDISVVDDDDKHQQQRVDDK